MRKTLLWGLALLLSAFWAHGQESLEEVTVSGTRAPLTLHQSARMVTVLDTLLIRSAPVQTVNHTRLNTFGQELSLRITPGTLLGRKDFFLRSLNAGYAHISQDKALEPGLQSAYALEYLRNKVVLQADFQITDKISLHTAYRWQLFLEANNLLNISYYDHGNIPQPGFWMRAGATFRIR